MDRNFRRVLYTALVAGGLMVAGASSAHAAEEGLLDPVTQETTGTIEHASATRGETGLVDDVVGTDGIVRSLLSADVAGVVDGTLGEDGLVDDLLTGAGSDDDEEPLPAEPGTGAPGTDEPGTDEPGTDEPGTDEPGTDEPGTDEPGTDEPGTDEPGTDEPGTDEPGTDEPGTDEPGTDEPGTDEPGTDEPGTDEPGTDEPGTDEPGTDEPGTDEPGTDEPGTDEPGTDKPGANKPGTAEPARPGTGSHDPGPRPVNPGAGDEGTDVPAESDAPTPRTDEPRTAEPRTAERRTRYSGSEPVSGATSGAIPVGHVPSDSAVLGRAGVQPVRGTAEAIGEHVPAQGVDLTWGATGGSIPTSSSGSIRSGDMDDRPHRPVSEPVAEPVARRVVPDATLAETGHIFTGQLSLISLLLGLGIAALRTRRR